MIILGIETAGPVGSVALLNSDGATREITFTSSRRLGAELAPAIRRLLEEAGLGPDAPPDLISVDIGPGSYTGLRIGLAAAKGLAFAWGRPLIGVSRVDAILPDVPSDRAPVLCALDASRGEIYSVLVTRDGGHLVHEATLADPVALSQTVSAPMHVVGEAASKLAGVPGVAVRQAIAWPSAVRIAEAARRQHMAGARHDAMRLAPTYYRPSEADEQRRQRKMRAS